MNYRLYGHLIAKIADDRTKRGNERFNGMRDTCRMIFFPYTLQLGGSIVTLLAEKSLPFTGVKNEKAPIS
jgi:hypothetical protein